VPAAGTAAFGLRHHSRGVVALAAGLATLITVVLAFLAWFAWLIAVCHDGGCFD
jgi:hypothetical protein